jgi:chromosome partitioning protein
MAATRGTVRVLTRDKASEKSITKNKLAIPPTPPPPIASGATAKRVAVTVGRRMKRTIRVLSAGAKGGPGKTFLCKNLAGAAAAEGYSVAVVDFDNQRSLSKWLQRRERMSSDKALIEGFAANPGSLADASEVLAMEEHDIIFYDTPPAIDQHPEVLKTLAYAADLVLVPSAVGIADTESAEVLLDLLRQWNRPTLAILNKVKRNANKTIGIAKKRLLRMADLCPIDIAEYYDFLVADEVGLGATEMDSCLGKDDIEAIWELVKRRSGLGDLADVG